MRQGIPQDGPKFGMMANYGKPKDKAKSATTEAAQQPKGHPGEPEVKKLWVKPSELGEATEEEGKTSAT
jgi:hypothetical protein